MRHRKINCTEEKRDAAKPTNCPTPPECMRETAGSFVRGDGQALQQLLSRYAPALYRTALRQLRNPVDADDAVQDALLSAFQHILQFEGRCQISTWLTRIVINTARMQLRRRDRHETLSLDQFYESENSILADQLVDAGPNPEEICEQAELREVLNKLLGRLPPELCRAIQLREIHGLSRLEVAKILGITESALKSRLLRARGKLGVLLRQALGETGARRSEVATEASGVTF